MRTFVLLLVCVTLLFATAGCGARKETVQDEPGLRTKVVEFEKPSTGKVRIERTFRGDDKVLYRMTTRKATTQILCLHGESRYIESDEDRDGVFESVMLPGESSTDFEKFTRQPDGTLKPLSTPALESLKRQATVAAESLSKLLDNPDMSPKQVADLVETNRQKIEAIKNEQSNRNEK